MAPVQERTPSPPACAIAHLLSETDMDVLLEDVPPIVERVGWEEALGAVFG